MPHSPSIEELLERNGQTAKKHQPIPSLSEISHLPADQQVAMPKIFLDAVVVRHAAGRIAPQLQNLLFLDNFLQFEEVMIMHHTDCSAELLGNNEVVQILTERAPGHESEITQLKLPGFKE
ncbi:hypothetical protein BX600DRAFT_468479 [Xylariales sp. PMI_506]|nr:hypothetical protein BX600DRAFT_468479 [Xylariales sp. PMI_506]